MDENKPEIQTIDLRLTEQDKPDKWVALHFFFLEGGDITGCMIPGYTFNQTAMRNARMPVSGATIRNPKDEMNRPYAMRLSCWRACCNIDGKMDYSQRADIRGGWSLGPIGKKIYAAFRSWQRSQPEQGQYFIQKWD